MAFGARMWVIGLVAATVVVGGGMVLTSVATAAPPADGCSGEVGAGDGDNRSATCQTVTNGAPGSGDANGCTGEVGNGDGDNRSAACQTASNGDTTIINVPPPMGGDKVATSGERFPASDEQATLAADGTDKVIGTLDLPVGSYALSALVRLNALGDVLTACDLTAEGDMYTAVADPDGRRDVLPLEIVHTFAAPGQAIVTCRDFDPDRFVALWDSVRITAIQVDSTQTATLGGE